MASFYTVVQYVPDPVTDERVNIGVIVAAEDTVQSRFLSNWRRVKQFGGTLESWLRTKLRSSVASSITTKNLKPFS